MTRPRPRQRSPVPQFTAVREKRDPFESSLLIRPPEELRQERPETVERQGGPTLWTAVRAFDAKVVCAALPRLVVHSVFRGC